MGFHNANRYENIEILKTELGKRYKKTIRYPKMEKTSEDKYIISIQGDRLDNLLRLSIMKIQDYGGYCCINNLGKGDMEIPIGTQLRIPHYYIEIYDEYLKLNN